MMTSICIRNLGRGSQVRVIVSRKAVEQGCRCFATLPDNLPKYDPSNIQSVFKNMPITDITTNALLYMILANKTVVDGAVRVATAFTFGKYSPRPLRFCTKHFLMWTALSNFYSGDYFVDSVDAIERLYTRDGITGITDHSFPEDESNEGRFKEYLEENIVDYSTLFKEKDNAGVRFAAVKPTALIDGGMLQRLTDIIDSSEDSEEDYETKVNNYLFLLNKDDRMKFNHGRARLEKNVRYATSNNISILLDAEKSDMQPGVEVIAQLVAQKYNKKHERAALYNTYQMYLRRTPAALKRDMALAKEKGYVFAAKIVRGAYMMSERETAEDGGEEDPVLPTREDTSDAYNSAVDSVLQAIAAAAQENSLLVSAAGTEEIYGEDGSRVERDIGVCIPSVMIASHNRISLQMAVDAMERLNLPNGSPQVHFAQILGMCDNLTVSLARSGMIQTYSLFLFFLIPHKNCKC